MQTAKDAAYWLLALVLTLICFGCVGAARRPFLQSRGQSPLARAQRGDRTPAPPLNIPDPVPVAERGAEIPAVPAPRAAAEVPAVPVSRAAGDFPTVPVSLPPPPPPRGQEPTPPAQPAPAETPPADPAARIRHLHRQAAEKYAAVESYTARLRRRENVGGKDKPEEVLLFKFRKQPWSAYFKWIGEESNGREAVYVKGRYENKIHTRLVPGDMPALLMPPNRRLALAVDSPMVVSASRRSIADAGVGTLVERFGALADAAEKGDSRRGTVSYLGPQARPESKKPYEAVQHVIPPGLEPHLPRGGKRVWLFDADPAWPLPVLVVTHDERGHEVEYYCYDRFLFTQFDDDDFNPDKLWPARR